MRLRELENGGSLKIRDARYVIVGVQIQNFWVCLLNSLPNELVPKCPLSLGHPFIPLICRKKVCKLACLQNGTFAKWDVCKMGLTHTFYIHIHSSEVDVRPYSVRVFLKSVCVLCAPNQTRTTNLLTLVWKMNESAWLAGN